MVSREDGRGGWEVAQLEENDEDAAIEKHLRW